MKNISIQINESDILRYGFTKEPINFSDLLGRIRLELAKEALLKCQTLAEKAGISGMTLEEINAEIKAVRNAKNHS